MTTTMKPIDKLLTTTEVARILRVNVLTVRRWIAAGALEAIELPGRGQWRQFRVKQSVVDALLGAREG